MLNTPAPSRACSAMDLSESGPTAPTSSKPAHSGLLRQGALGELARSGHLHLRELGAHAKTLGDLVISPARKRGLARSLLRDEQVQPGILRPRRHPRLDQWGRPRPKDVARSLLASALCILGRQPHQFRSTDPHPHSGRVRERGTRSHAQYLSGETPPRTRHLTAVPTRRRGPLRSGSAARGRGCRRRVGVIPARPRSPTVASSAVTGLATAAASRGARSSARPGRPPRQIAPQTAGKSPARSPRPRLRALP